MKIHQIHVQFLGFVTQHMLTGNEIGVSMINLFGFIIQQVVTKNVECLLMMIQFNILIIIYSRFVLDASSGSGLTRFWERLDSTPTGSGLFFSGYISVRQKSMVTRHFTMKRNLPPM